MVFSPIAFQPEPQIPSSEQAAEQELSDTVPTRGFAGLRMSVAESVKRIFYPNDVS